jgi:ATP-dependent protease Clp ATPase subunit
MIKCSFCDKNNNEVRYLVNKGDVYICDECVLQCLRIIIDNFEIKFD